ncbi:hypothetical protein FQR65_LT02885 [Abscondita terminalis]|nr:hypothetical protein FQR65_LT02885 [Abscondita terminalis]
MDILDPLETSAEEAIETKVVINQGLSIVDEQVMDSDEDQRVVDHLSPQTLLETPPDGEVQYSFRSPEGTITYRVLQVDEASENVPQIVTAGTNFQSAGVQQVLTSNLNGQLFVIGNASEAFNSQTGSRSIAPRASLIDTTSAALTNMKKRDERRRATHNEVERRRRDKINNWITKLSKIIPENNATEMKGNGHYEGQSKGGILAKACEYIVELKEQQQKLDVCMIENKQLCQNVEILQQQNMALERENHALKEFLKRNGLEVPKEFLS